MRWKDKKIIAVMAAMIFLSGCNSCSVNGQNADDTLVNPPTVHVETFISGLEIPWSLEFTKDGRLFITERNGRIRLVDKGQLLPTPLATLNDVETVGETGLMGLALHPNFLDNDLLYICYAYNGKSSDIRVRVKRMKMVGMSVVDDKIIIEDVPAAEYHAGCRLKFGPDGKLYITTGDATKRALAQKLDSLAGKTLRLNDDGTIPSDNPFVTNPKARKEIWSYGHRNAQGIDFQPGSNLMFQTEHGPSGFDGPGGGDEVNIVERGQNFGWPIVHHDQKKMGMISPLLEYTPAVAPAGAVFYNSKKYPEWVGNFFFACLQGKSLIRVVLDGRNVAKQERLFFNRFGRLRDVTVGPDGALYIATSNRDGRGLQAKDDDRILRMTAIKL